MLSQILLLLGGGRGIEREIGGGGLDTFSSRCKKHFPNGQAVASMY